MPLDNPTFSKWSGETTFVYDARGLPVSIQQPDGWTYQRIPATSDPGSIAQCLHRDDGWLIGASEMAFRGWLQHTRRIQLKKGQRYIFKLEATPQVWARGEPQKLNLFWTFNDGLRSVYSRVRAAEAGRVKTVVALVEASESGLYSVGVGVECPEVLQTAEVSFHEVTFEAVPADYGGPSVTRLMPLEADPTEPPTPTPPKSELGDLIRRFLEAHQAEIDAEKLLYAAYIMSAAANEEVAKAHDKRAQALQAQALIVNEAAEWLDATTQEGLAAMLALRAQENIEQFLLSQHKSKPPNPN